MIWTNKGNVLKIDTNVLPVRSLTFKKAGHVFSYGITVWASYRIDDIYPR